MQILEDISISSRHQKYRKLPLYADIVNYLKERVPSLEDLNHNRKRQIIQKAKKYILSKDRDISSLCYYEKNGALSICILDSEIKQFLTAAHENHGHFTVELSLDFLIGQTY